MYHFDLYEEVIVISNITMLSAEALNNLDEVINICNLTRSYNSIKGSACDFYRFLNLITDSSYCMI